MKYRCWCNEWGHWCCKINCLWPCFTSSLDASTAKIAQRFKCKFVQLRVNWDLSSDCESAQHGTVCCKSHLGSLTGLLIQANNNNWMLSGVTDPDGTLEWSCTEERQLLVKGKLGLSYSLKSIHMISSVSGSLFCCIRLTYYIHFWYGTHLLGFP